MNNEITTVVPGHIGAPEEDGRLALILGCGIGCTLSILVILLLIVLVSIWLIRKKTSALSFEKRKSTIHAVAGLEMKKRKSIMSNFESMAKEPNDIIKKYDMTIPDIVITPEESDGQTEDKIQVNRVSAFSNVSVDSKAGYSTIEDFHQSINQAQQGKYDTVEVSQEFTSVEKHDLNGSFTESNNNNEYDYADFSGQVVHSINTNANGYSYTIADKPSNIFQQLQLQNNDPVAHEMAHGTESVHRDEQFQIDDSESVKSHSVVSIMSDKPDYDTQQCNQNQDGTENAKDSNDVYTSVNKVNSSRSPTTHTDEEIDYNILPPIPEKKPGWDEPNPIYARDNNASQVKENENNNAEITNVINIPVENIKSKECSNRLSVISTSGSAGYSTIGEFQQSLKSSGLAINRQSFSPSDNYASIDELELQPTRETNDNTFNSTKQSKTSDAIGNLHKTNDTVYSDNGYSNISQTEDPEYEELP